MIRFSNVAQVVQVCKNGERRLSGSAQNEVAVIENGSVVIDSETGLIVAVDTEIKLAAEFSNVDNVVDCSGKCLLPGLVDAHTHPGQTTPNYYNNL
jgi:imidazolonepropionase